MCIRDRDGVLKDGAQQRIGAQALGLGVEDGEQVGAAVGLRAGPPAVLIAAQRKARAGFGIYQKEQRVAGGDKHLRVIAVGLQFPAACQQQGFQLCLLYTSRCV